MQEYKQLLYIFLQESMYNDIDVWELYDLQADPTEMHNLYGQKEYEPVVTELKTELARLQEQYKDPVRFSPDRDKE